MDAEKLTINMEFEVWYADGLCKEVKEGILFEFRGDQITLHIGTSRKECLFSVAEALTEAIVKMGLGEEFEEYVTRSSRLERLGKNAKINAREKQWDKDRVLVTGEERRPGAETGSI